MGSSWGENGSCQPHALCCGFLTSNVHHYDLSILKSWQVRSKSPRVLIAPGPNITHLSELCPQIDPLKSPKANLPSSPRNSHRHFCRPLRSRSLSKLRSRTLRLCQPTSTVPGTSTNMPSQDRDMREHRSASPPSIFRGSDSVLVEVCLVVIALFFPFFVVYIKRGLDVHFWINLVLWLFGWVPAVIHAWVILLVSQPLRSITRRKREDRD